MERGTAEEQMNSFLQNRDYKSFLDAYNLFLCSGSDSTYFKSIALLCHLADSNNLEFNKLIQTTDRSEINNEYIETVVRVSDSILRFDFESFKLILRNCVDVYKPLVEKIIENQRRLMESSLNHNTGDSNALTKVSGDAVETLKDCVFVIRNFMGD